MKAERPEKLRRLITGGVFLRLVRGVLQGFTIILLVRVLSTDEFGTYAYLIALSQIISIPAQFGLPQLVVRDASPLAALGNGPALKALAQWASRMVIITSALGVFVGVCAISLMDATVASVMSIALAMSLVPMASTINLLSSQLRAMGVGLRSQISEMVIAPTLFFGFVLAIYLIKIDGFANVSGVLALRAVALLVSVLAVQWLLRRAFVSLKQRSSPKTVRPKEMSRKGLLKSSFVLGLSAGMFALNNQMDLMMVTNIQGVEHTAIYRVAILMSFAVAVVAQSLNSAISPAMSRTLKLGSVEDLHALIAQHMPRVQLVVWLGLLLWISAAKPVLSLAFGSEYLASFAPMAILCLSACVNLLFGPAGLLLNLSGNEGVGLAAGALALTMNVGLNLALIPIYGLVGAAIATLAATLVFNLILWVQAQKKIGVNTLRWIIPF